MEHAALLAAGVLALVGVRRRRRLRAAMPRHRVPEPRPEAVETERRLRAVDAGERALRVDVACRAAAWSLIGTGAQIGWVEVTPDGDVGLRLSAPADLPAPWAGSDQDWRLAADVPVELLSDGARRVGMPCVALVQLGVTAAGADVLIDVEACGTLAVEARRDQADEVITGARCGAGLVDVCRGRPSHRRRTREYRSSRTPKHPCRRLDPMAPWSWHAHSWGRPSTTSEHRSNCARCEPEARCGNPPWCWSATERCRTARSCRSAATESGSSHGSLRANFRMRRRDSSVRSTRGA